MTYRLTSRGKFVLSLFILVLVAIIYISGRYILNYFSIPEQELNSALSTTEQSNEENTSEAITEETQESITEESSEETTEIVTEDVSPTEEVQRIYSMYELDDLRRYKMIVYFDSSAETIDLGKGDLDSLKSMISQYPGEKIAIAGHVNGYPSYEKNEDALELSLKRAHYIRDIFIDLGIDESKISVYNFGLEKPLYRDYGNQDKNNRVEIYFEDHFANGVGGK